jgi:hypothetical protein
MAAIVDRMNFIPGDLKALNSVMRDISFSGRDLETLEAVAVNLKDTTGNLIENGPPKTPLGGAGMERKTGSARVLIPSHYAEVSARRWGTANVLIGVLLTVVCSPNMSGIRELI